jgi:hypothetical protein
MNPLIWEVLNTNEFGTLMRRAKVLGGWLVYASFGAGGGLAFYPDPEHVWDGSSLP